MHRWRMPINFWLESNLEPVLHEFQAETEAQLKSQANSDEKFKSRDLKVTEQSAAEISVRRRLKRNWTTK